MNITRSKGTIYHKILFIGRTRFKKGCNEQYRYLPVGYSQVNLA